jgi:sortase A
MFAAVTLVLRSGGAHPPDPSQNRARGPANGLRARPLGSQTSSALRHQAGMKAMPAATLTIASATRQLRRIGIVIPLALALMLGGGVLVGQAVWIHAKALLAQVLLERAFAQTLATGTDVKPWSWADTWPVARVSVPRLGRSAIVLAGASGQALAFGPAHVERTPAAGEPGTAVFSAHRDTHFAFLGEVAVGDEIGVTRRDGRHFRFRVTAVSVARWDASGIDPLAAGRRLVLVTCWPLAATIPGPLRYLVHAEMMDNGPKEANSE